MFAREKSVALKKFYDAFNRNGKSMCRQFEMHDQNKDGLLNLDGFLACCLVNEIG